ncbi:MAG TPA: pyridoxamine 5'-phosphate oxidase family protein [Polyangia bacterium]|nr:pyridoxamine 5'-phosphate oxidase family protein [Polyangia bacterium]
MSTTTAQPLAGPLGSLPADLFPLLEGASIMHLATRNAALEPMSVLGFGLRVEDGGRQLTLFLPATLSEVPLRNLRDNGQMAISVVRPTDSRALQIKGIWLGERRTDESDRAFVSSYRDALTQTLGLVGVPRSMWQRVVWWPSLALRMEPREVFVQTPGPSAGSRCGGGAGPS